MCSDEGSCTKKSMRFYKEGEKGAIVQKGGGCVVVQRKNDQVMWTGTEARSGGDGTRVNAKLMNV